MCPGLTEWPPIFTPNRLQFSMNGFLYVLQWGQLADVFDRTNRTWTVFVPTIDGFLNVIRTFSIDSGRQTALAKDIDLTSQVQGVSHLMRGHTALDRRRSTICLLTRRCSRTIWRMEWCWKRHCLDTTLRCVL